MLQACIGQVEKSNIATLTVSPDRIALVALLVVTPALQERFLFMGCPASAATEVATCAFRSAIVACLAILQSNAVPSTVCECMWFCGSVLFFFHMLLWSVNAFILESIVQSSRGCNITISSSRIHVNGMVA